MKMRVLLALLCLCLLLSACTAVPSEVQTTKTAEMPGQEQGNQPNSTEPPVQSEKEFVEAVYDELPVEDSYYQYGNMQINAALNVEDSIIATGGSVVYGEEAMRHLKAIGTVIYLKLSYEAIEERLGDLHARGVTIKPGWTLRDLYNERVPLYEKWADITVDCEKLRLREVVEYIRRQIDP